MVRLTTRVVTFKADDELVEKIDKLAKELGSTRSDIIRMAVINYLEQVGREHPLKKPKFKAILQRYRVYKRRF